MKGGKGMRTEYKKVIEMVKRGIPDKEIMKELGVRTKTSLKRIYYDALVEAGKIKDILTERQVKRAVRRKRPLRISKRGTILLGKALVIDNFGFKEGDEFTVSKRKGTIILTKGNKEALSEPSE
jgi:hypothetical protein